MVFRNRRFQFSFVHHLGNIFDGHHLPFEHRKNFWQRYGAHLHVSEGELFTRDSPREIVHQFFFTDGEALYDSSFLPLEWFAFKDLRNAPAQKVDSRLHVLLEPIGLSACQRQEPRAVRNFEIIHVTAIQ